MTSSVDKLGRRVADLEELVKKLARQPRLGNSSIEGGGIDQYASDGSLGSRFGEQWDGTNGIPLFTGPPPPRPNPPTVDPIIGGFKVRYDGTFADSPFTVAPMDFSHYEVHVSTNAGMSGLLFDTLRGTINTARGAELIVSTGQPPEGSQGFYFLVIARSLAGKASSPSQVVGPFLPDKVATADLGFDIEDLSGSKISRGPDEPVDPRYGDLWLRTPENVPYQYSPAGPGQAEDFWAEVRDAGVVEAIDKAFEALGVANDAVLGASQAKTFADTAQARADAAYDAAIDADNDAAAARSLAAAAQNTANSKITVYRQTSAPVGGLFSANDLWMDTDDGNRLYAWSGSAWVLSDDQRIVTALTNAATAQTTAGAKTTVFAQISQPATTGRVVGDTWIDTDDSNRLYVWNGSTWFSTKFGANAIAATARQLGALTIYRQASQPTTGMIAGDYWIDSDDNKPYYYSGSTWVLSQDTAINSAVQAAATAQATADGKVRVFSQISPPTGLTATDVDDLWIDTDAGNLVHTWSGTAWIPRTVGNAAIEPNSLVASTVLATGSITAPLLQSILVLATMIIAGNPDGNHARMDQNGFRVFADDPIDGIPNEVIRQGTDTNDYWAIINANGMTVASVDDTGGAAFKRLVADTISLNGAELGTLLSDLPQGEVGRFSQKPASEIGKIFPGYGVAEVGAAMVAGRAYRIDYRASFRVEILNDEILFVLRHTKGATGDVITQAPAPKLNSASIGTHRQTGTATTARWHTVTGSMQFYPTTTTRYRVLLSAEKGPAGSTLGGFFIPPDPVELMITDLGPAGPISGGFTGAGGTLLAPTSSDPTPTTPPPPASTSQQYAVDLPPAGWWAYRGDGSQRTDVPGPVQGWDPSGYNGDGRGLWAFNLPSITGRIDFMSVLLYSNHWYYNSGGTAILNCTPNGAPFAKPRGDFHVAGFPKPGFKEVMLPADWYPLFTNNGAYGYPRCNGISVGQSGGTNPAFYGRFDGPSARLRIRYTQ